MHCAFQVFCPCCEIVAKGDPDPPQNHPRPPNEWGGQYTPYILQIYARTQTYVDNSPCKGWFYGFLTARVSGVFGQVGCLWTGRVSLDTVGTVFGQLLVHSCTYQAHYIHESGSVLSETHVVVSHTPLLECGITPTLLCSV